MDYIFSTVHKFKGLECDTVENETSVDSSDAALFTIAVNIAGATVE